jgi:hypothetical protein
VGTSDQHLVHLPYRCYTKLPKAYICEWGLWIIGDIGSSRTAPLPWGHLLPSTSFLQILLHSGSTPQGAWHRRLQLCWWLLPDIPATSPRGAAIDVFFNFGGGCYRTYRQYPPGGLPSMSSSTTVVVAVGHTGSTPSGGQPSTSSSTTVVAAADHTGSTP